MAIFDQNQSVYEKADVVSEYVETNWIQPPEAILMMRYIQSIFQRRVLDIGVGTGRTTRFLQEITQQYVGVDYSNEMVKVCRKCFSELTFFHCDVCDLKRFEPGSFDFVLFSFNGLDYISHDDRKLALRQIHRVLRPGGCLCSLLTIATTRRQSRIRN